MTITRITAVLLLAACAARGQLAHRWLAEASRTAPQEIAVYRGETLALEPTVTVHGEAYAWPDGTAVTLYWQTNGMAASWWSAPAALGTSTGALRAVWSPACDAGAERYTFFIRAAAPSGTAYRASGTLRMIHSPGAEPNALPLPVQTLDFSTVTLTNAPWVTADDWQSGSNSLAAALQAAVTNLNLYAVPADGGKHALWIKE